MNYDQLGSFIDIARKIIDIIEQEEMEVIESAAEKVADSISSDGLIHIFGTGHSHILAEEVFGRAGGFAPVNAILEPSLMLHNGIKYSQFERLKGYGSILCDYYDVSKNDVMIIISNSGVNAAPVEMALESVDRDAFTVAITAMEYTKYLEASHPSGKKLYQIADLVIDNKGVPGDAALKIEDLGQRIAPTSTVSGAVILNSIFANVGKIMKDRGEEPPVFKSSNMEGAKVNNEELFERYKGRVKHF